MPIQLRESHPTHSSALAPAGIRARSARRRWLALLLGVLALGFLALSALALVGIAGLLVGLGSAPPPSANTPVAQRTAVVLVIPAAAPVEERPQMPAPAELAVLAASRLPTAISQPATEAETAPAILPAPKPESEPALEPVSQNPRELSPTPFRQETQEESRQESREESRQEIRVDTQEEIRIVTYADLFRAVGEQSGIDWRLLAALAYRESRMDPVALGRDGDMGLMQILPTTWDEFAPQVAASNPFDPQENVHVAAAYLVYLQDFVLGLKTNDLRWVLAAYNWGPERVRRLLAGGGAWEDVPAQQQGYVADILYAAFGETAFDDTDSDNATFGAENSEYE